MSKQIGECFKSTGLQVQIQAVYRGGQERSNILEKNEEEEEDGN